MTAATGKVVCRRTNRKVIMGSKKNVSVDGAQDQVKIIGQQAEQFEDKATETAKRDNKNTKAAARSARYKAVRSLVDRSKLYTAQEAFDLVKKTSYTSFAGTVSAAVVLKETNNQITVSFPHSTGKALRVAIADDEVLTDIEAGKLDFDVLLTTPQYMPKLAKLARILGPKGLMPNPKNNTIVADPEKAKAELLGGKTVLKTERKAPLLHATLGKTTMSSEQLADNLQALLKAVDGKVVKVVVSSTMSPGVRVQLAASN